MIKLTRKFTEIMKKYYLILSLFSSFGLASCATIVEPTEDLNQIGNGSHIVSESPSLDIDFNSALPDQVCWFDGEAYELGAIKCQYKIEDNDLDTRLAPFQCQKIKDRYIWKNTSIQNC